MNDALADAPVFNNVVVVEDHHASEIVAMLERKGFVLQEDNDG